MRQTAKRAAFSVWRAGIAVWLLVAAAPAWAQDEPESAVVAIVVGAGSGVEAWRANALEQTLGREIARHERLELALDPAVDLSACAAGDVGCAVTAYRAAGIDVVLLGALAGDRLDYQLHKTWPADASLVGAGSIATRDTDLAGVRAALGDALEPLVGIGGVLTELGFASRNDPSVEAASSAPALPWSGSLGALVLVFGAIAVLLALPLLLGVVVVRDLSALVRLRSFRWTPALWVALAALAYGLAQPEVIALLTAFEPGAVAAGGLAWGWFAIACGQVMFPSFHGLERVEHRDVGRLLRAWALAALQRTVRLALFYAPFAVGFWLAVEALEAPALAAYAVAAPIAGLVVRYGYFSVIEIVSARLDRDLVEGEPTVDDAWHVAVRGYVGGYVRRSGWPAPVDLLDRILFLPGTSDEIFSYGGGLTHSRVVVGRKILELALAPYGRPHDAAAPREDHLHWSSWNAGLVVPRDAQAVAPQPREPLMHPETGESEFLKLGQAPTLAGFVEPSALDERETYRPTEDPTWLDWDPTELHDGTDPEDKDFLFGAVVREIGEIHRHEQHLFTLGLFGRGWHRGRSARTRRILRWATLPFAPLFRRYSVIVADSFAALNFARDHLVQWLAWELWTREEHLTARAFAPELARRSQEIFATLETDEPGGGVTETQAGARRRLVALSEYSQAPMRAPRAVWLNRAVVAGAILGALALAGVGVVRAIDYHPRYIEHIEKQKRRIDKSKRNDSREDEGLPADGKRN